MQENNKPDGFSNVNAISRFNAPQNSLIPISKTTDVIFGQGCFEKTGESTRDAYGAAAAEETDDVGNRVRVSEGRGDCAVFVENCCIDFSELKEAGLPESIGFYDMLVFSAVCSIIETENLCCTPRQILSVMTGGRNSRTSEPVGSIRDIEQSVEKMSRTCISFDWTEQARAWNIDPERDGISSCRIEEHMLSIRKYTRRTRNGSQVTAYEILSYPGLLRYVKAVKQYILISNDIMDINVPMTRHNMLIRGYLIRKVEQLKKSGKRSKASNNCVRFDTMIGRLDLGAGTRKSEKAVKDAALRILDCFAEKGYIKDYDVLTEAHGKISSVRINI